MAFTKITGPGIHTLSNIMSHNVKSSGIITAVNGNLTGWLAVGSTASFGGDVTVGGTLTYDDVTNIDSVGLITARAGIHVGAGGSIIHAVSSNAGQVLINAVAVEGGTNTKLCVVGSGTPNINPSTIASSTLATFRMTGGLSHAAGISIIGGNTGSSVLNFGDRDSELIGRIIYNHTTDNLQDYMGFYVQGGEKLRVTGIGSVQIAGGAGGHLQIDSNGEFELFEQNTSLTMNHSSKISMDFDSTKRIARLRSSHNGSGANAVSRSLAFFIGSTEAIRIRDINRNVGIGTTNPTAKLHVATYTYDNPDNENFFRIKLQDQGGVMNDVGIGQIASGCLSFNNTASGRFSFHNGTNGEIFRIASSGSNNGGVGISTAGGNIGPDGNALLIRARSTVGTDKGHIMLTGDSATVDEGPQIVFSESGSGSNFVGGAIGFRRTGGNSVGDLVFGVRTVSGVATTPPTEVVRITSVGNVGIGTTNPLDKLSISAAPNSLVFGAKDTTRNNHIFQLLADDSAGHGELRLYKNSGSGTHEKTVEIASSGDTYFNGGFIGAGTANPRRHFHLHNSATATVGFQMTNGGTGESNDSQGFQLKVGSDGHAEIAQMEDSNLRIFTDAEERLRITSDGYIHAGNTGHGTTAVGGQAVTGNDFAPYVKILSNTANSWSMQIRNDTNTRSNGIFLRAGNNNTSTYTLYATGTNEHYPSFVVRGDGNVGIGSSSPASRLQIFGNAEFNAYDNSNGQQGYYSPKGLIIGNAFDNSVGNACTDDRNGIIWQERGLDFDVGVNNQFHTKFSIFGRIGIGHSAPNAKLHIGNLGNTDSAVGSSSNPALQIGNTTNYRFGVYTDNETAFFYNKNGDDGFHFLTKTTSGGNATKFKIHKDQNYGDDDYAQTGTGNQGGTSQAHPTGVIEWQNNTGNGINRYNCYIQATAGNETDMYITVRNSSFYRITVKASHNSTSADVAMYLVYGLNSQVTGNKIVEVIDSGQFTCTNHNTHVNSHDSTIKISYGGSANQGLRAFVETIGGF